MRLSLQRSPCILTVSATPPYCLSVGLASKLARLPFLPLVPMPLHARRLAGDAARDGPGFALSHPKRRTYRAPQHRPQRHAPACRAGSPAGLRCVPRAGSSHPAKSAGFPRFARCKLPTLASLGALVSPLRPLDTPPLLIRTATPTLPAPRDQPRLSTRSARRFRSSLHRLVSLASRPFTVSGLRPTSG